MINVQKHAYKLTKVLSYSICTLTPFLLSPGFGNVYAASTVHLGNTEKNQTWPRWGAGKCLMKFLREKKESLFSSFSGINTPAMADLNLPII